MTASGINYHKLSNELRIVHAEDISTPNICFDILYDVGSRDENPELTGLAHLFEHLMFGGSPNVRQFDRELEYAGGWSNAWTSADFTNFYDVLPAINAETAFRIESDRMNSLLFSHESLETQRSVVLEEFKQTCLNQPYGDMSHLIHGLVYERHPYRFPVIGKEPEHIERVSNEDVRNFFFSHYGPNNAVLSVTGGLTFDQVCSLAEKWFGDIAPIDVRVRNLPAEPEIDSPRRLTVRRKVPFPRITIAFPMAGRDDYGTPEYEAADAITDILALGRSSRFYRKFIVPGIFTLADASIFGSRDAGYLMINAQVEENNDEAIEAAEQRLWAELDQLKTDGVSSTELHKVVNKLITRMEAGNVGFISKAQSMALNTIMGITDDYIVDRYKSLTPETIRETARKIMEPGRSATLIYRPE